MKKISSERAKSFIATRSHHLFELAEDYVEIIFDLIEQKNEAKICDIAAYMGVSHVTVIRALERLKKKGYVSTTQPVSLSPEGEKLAILCKERHRFLLKYLIALGVPEDIATIDVEGMEHHVSQTTMDAFKYHLEHLENI